MQNDKNTNLEILKELLREFRDERDWFQFHDPKNLAEAISIEAGELQELFLWKDKDTIIKEIEEDLIFRERIGEELADVLIFCINFANATNLDISSIIIDKMKKANKKYPVKKARGKSTKYTEL